MVVPILFCMLAVLVQGAVCARWPRWRYDVVALCLLAGVAAAVLLVSSAGQDSVQYSVLHKAMMCVYDVDFSTLSISLKGTTSVM